MKTQSASPTQYKCSAIATQILILCSLALASGCGGGTNPGTTAIEAPPVVESAPPSVEPAPVELRALPANLSTDDVPSGTSSLSGFDYLPLEPGSRFTYRNLDSQSLQIHHVSEVVSPSVGSSFRSVLEYPGGGSDAFLSQSFKKTPSGWQYAVSDTDVPVKYRNAAESIVYMPAQLYASGQTRRLTRQGDIGEDLDEDGHVDGFQIVFEQIFRGTQTLSLYGQSVTVAVLESTLTQVFVPSSLEFSTASTVVFQREYFQAGVGLVQSLIRAGSEPAVSTELYDAEIRGAFWRDQLFADGPVLRPRVNLIQQLVYSSTSNRYYAIEANSSNAAQGNAIAIINPSDGSVSRKQIPGVLSKLAISSDGSVMYAGFLDSATIVKLQLPTLSQLATYTFALPPASLLQRPYIESVAVDPLDANRIAAKFSTRASPGAIGIYVIKNGAVEAVFNETASVDTYPATALVANTLFFGTSHELFTAGSEILATEILNRLDVNGALITKSHSRDSSNDSGFHYFDGSGAPRVLNGHFIIKNSLYSASNLSFLRTLPGNECSFVDTFIGCQTLDADARISMQIVDRSTYEVSSNIRLSEDIGSGGSFAKIVAGPLGQIALFTGAGSVLKLIRYPVPPP
jgi:hypothetical protein